MKRCFLLNALLNYLLHWEGGSKLESTSQANGRRYHAYCWEAGAFGLLWRNQIGHFFAWWLGFKTAAILSHCCVETSNCITFLIKHLDFSTRVPVCHLRTPMISFPLKKIQVKKTVRTNSIPQSLLVLREAPTLRPWPQWERFPCHFPHSRLYFKGLWVVALFLLAGSVAPASWQNDKTLRIGT